MSKTKKIISVLIILVLLVAIVAMIVNVTMAKVDKKHNPVVTMDVEGYGTIKIELYPDMAPNTVKNFIRLAQRGFYNGKTFNDIEEGLVRGGAVVEEETTDDKKEDDKKEDTTATVETGEEEKTATGPKYSDIRDLAEGEEDKVYSIPGEFMEKGFDDNTLAHQRGVISMYRKTSSLYQQEIAMMQMMGYTDYLDTILNKLYDSQDSQFFILTENNSDFDGTFTAFGRVTEGMEVVDKIAKLELKKETSEDGEKNDSTKPVKPAVISNVTVDTFGVDYGEPQVEEVFDFDAIFNVFMQNYMQSSSTVTTD